MHRSIVSKVADNPIQQDTQLQYFFTSQAVGTVSVERPARNPDCSGGARWLMTGNAPVGIQKGVQGVSIEPTSSTSGRL